MSEITLLRHGQASFGQENYDQLSQLGYLQSVWLGQHLRSLGNCYDRIVIGSMARHRETAQGVLEGLDANIALEVHNGINEYDFQGLLNPFRKLYPHEWHATENAKRDYYHNMKAALGYWMNGDIADDGRDTWHSFCERIRQGFEFACDHDARRTLVVSSGGPISVMLGNIWNLNNDSIRNLTLQIKNSSTSKLLYNRRHFTVDSFNDISHLLTSERQHAITFS